MNFLRNLYLALVFRMFPTVHEFLDSDGTCTFRKGIFSFALPPSKQRPELFEVLKKQGIDSLMTNPGNTILKDSRTTTAVISRLPSGFPVFLKRNNNKGFGFTLRKLFLPDRSFGAANAAAKIAHLGISTPRALLAGEARHGLKLLRGYLVTECVVSAIDLADFFEKDADAPAKADLILEHMMHTAATLHSGGIYHGDLKIVNFYCGDASSFQLGVWDLDSVRIFRDGVPYQYRIRELGRIVSSLLIVAEKNPAFQDTFFDLPALAERAAGFYCSFAPPNLPVITRDVINVAIIRWLSAPTLKHHYGVRKS